MNCAVCGADADGAEDGVADIGDDAAMFVQVQGHDAENIGHGERIGKFRFFQRPWHGVRIGMFEVFRA